MAIVPKAKREVTDRLRCATASAATSASCPTRQGKYEMGDIGVQPVVHPQIARRSARATPPQKAGLQTGDVILAAGGEAQTRHAHEPG